jgi:cell division protein FtsW
MSVSSSRSPIAAWWVSIDRTTLTCGLALIGIGLIVALAASPAATGRIDIEDPFYFFSRQLMFAVAGVVVMFGASALAPVGVQRAAICTFAVSIGVMAAILLVGAETKGARRWLDFGVFSVQPTEVLKPALVVLAAWLFAERARRPWAPGGLIAFCLYAVSVALLVAQPDVGQTALITLAFMAVFFIAGMPWLWIAGLGVAAVIGAAAVYLALPHVSARVEAFLNPTGSGGYQISKALDAIAYGGVLGRGPGEGAIKHQLPDAHSDFVFAVFAEEYGLMAAGGLLILFACVVVCGLREARRAEDPFRQFAAAGLFVLFGLQAACNVAGNLNLIPPKGMTLPFISYGGSSMIGSALTLGFALALTRRPRRAVPPDAPARPGTTAGRLS